jgi:hypothetical protein
MKIIAAFIFLILCFSQSAFAEDCSKIKDKGKRLTCYDHVHQQGSEASPAREISSCPNFEYKSNALLDRISVGFQHVSEFNPLVAELLTEFNECRKKQPDTDRLGAYAKNMQAFLAARDIYADGIELCQHFSDCRSWKDMQASSYFIERWKSNYPAIQSNMGRCHKFYSCFDDAIDSTARFF